MRHVVPWFVLVLALLLSSWAAWRADRLSDAAERDPGAPGLAAPPPASDEPAQRPPKEAPPLATPPAPADTDAAWRASIESRLDALARRFDALEAEREEMRAFFDEVVSARIAANEGAARQAASQSIASQAVLQQWARIDEDRDGTGEYGGFFAMAGGPDARLAKPLVPPVLQPLFADLSPSGEAVREGYVYRMYLADSTGAGVGETSEGFPAGRVSADFAETTWCLYGWPEAYGRTGRHTVFTNQSGDVLWTDAPAYSGKGHGPAPDAAFLPEGRGRITGRPALGEKGVDGNVWKMAD